MSEEQNHCHSKKPKVQPSCCAPANTTESCHSPKKRFDWLLWGSALFVVLFYAARLVMPETLLTSWFGVLALTVFELMNTMWWGIVLGVIALGLLSQVPREFVMSALGSHQGGRGVVRAALAGLLLDLCNHGILMVGAKLYERGASLGQVMAFLIASPWNSFSLTLIMIALMGWKWTLAFILLSFAIALVTGWLFDLLVKYRKLPSNPNTVDLPENFAFWAEAKRALSNVRWNLALIRKMLVEGLLDSRMVLRWMLFGVLLAAVIRALVPIEVFGQYFGPTLLGLSLTVLAATIIEVCSEGSTPIAADLLNRGNAPGNSFAFLMTGVSTDYTEIMVLRETTNSWKIALFLPLLTVPQVLAVAWVLNGFT